MCNIAQRDQSTAGVLQTKAILTKAELAFGRAKTLVKRISFSQSDFDQARADYESAQASNAQAAAYVNQAEGEPAARTTILSPMDGTVSHSIRNSVSGCSGRINFRGRRSMTHR